MTGASGPTACRLEKKQLCQRWAGRTRGRGPFAWRGGGGGAAGPTGGWCRLSRRGAGGQTVQT